MKIDISTPGLLFPAISLLFLAYTNRFLSLATLIRSLHAKYSMEKRSVIEGQIKNLRKRLTFIKLMQIFGLVSFICCVLSIIFLFAEVDLIGNILFLLSLGLLLVSLIYSFLEINISTTALNLELSDMEDI